MPEASLIITNSGIPGVEPEPGFIPHGELTLNWADSALYWKDINNIIQSVSIRGVPPIELAGEIPLNEGPWAALQYPTNPANTAYVPVQKEVGTLPQIKIGLIATGPNTVVVDGTDITVSVIAGTTANAVKALVDGDAAASALIYFYNAPGSTGAGIVTPDPIGSATFGDVNEVGGTRSEIIGQIAIVTHTGGTITEWAAVTIAPTNWMPRTPGIVYNRTLTQWERTYIADGSIQTELLPDQ